MILGGIIGIFIGYLLADTQKDHSETLLRNLNRLSDRHEGRFTLADLTLETQIHPTKVKKHLKKIVQELEIKRQVNQEGNIFYQLPTTKYLKIDNG